MVFAKHKPQPETAAELIARLRGTHVAGADLKSLIEITHRFVAEDLERQVAILKASRDGSSLPTSVLEGQLVKNRCTCFAALSWLGR